MAETQLPYLGTEGYVTRPASIARAQREALDGTVTERQSRILAYLNDKPEGAIWAEVGEALGLHHGQVSASLSVLHQAGEVFQLRHTINRSHPYIHKRFRYIYIANERYDEPTRTSAKLLRGRIDLAISWLEASDCEAYDPAFCIRAALSALNGESDAQV